MVVTAGIRGGGVTDRGTHRADDRLAGRDAAGVRRAGLRVPRVDHDAAFIAASALASFVSTIGTILFSTVYVLVAQRNGMLVSLSSAQATWFVLRPCCPFIDWTLAARDAACGHRLFGRDRADASAPPCADAAAERRWYDVPLRAGMVSTLVLVVVSVSTIFGPYVTGILAVFPVVFTSLILILHPRVGGPPTAAVIANSMVGMIGFALALAALHLTAVPLGSPLALTLALAICIGWNLTLFASAARKSVIGPRALHIALPPRSGGEGGPSEAEDRVGDVSKLTLHPGSCHRVRRPSPP